MKIKKKLRGVGNEQRKETAAIFFNNHADSASGSPSVPVDESGNVEV